MQEKHRQFRHADYATVGGCRFRSASTGTVNALTNRAKPIPRAAKRRWDKDRHLSSILRVTEEKVAIQKAKARAAKERPKERG